MTLSTSDLAQVFVALAVLTAAAHACGHAFARLRQPRVIGEIVGGLLLGPTLLGGLFPAQHAWVFSAPAVGAVLGAVYQLGLLLLMFLSGTEVRRLLARDDARTISFVTVAGMLLPFLAGIAYLQVVEPSGLQGARSTPIAFLLIFGIAIAVTSIPVISRIMYDLGVLDTSFARIVLGAAVIEDILLYVVLAIALGLAQGQSEDAFGVQAWLGSAGSARALSYHVLVSVALLVVLLRVGPGLYRRTAASRLNLVARSSPVAFQLVFVMGFAALCLFLGVVPLFGAFLAGIVTARSRESSESALATVKTFSTAFFIPVYFAIVGLRLDLIQHFDLTFFLLFTAFACAVKSLSVYGGSRLAGEARRTSRNLAVAMNARGGPGIVLASVAYDAGIISRNFSASLVMLALVTSLMAGAWLQRVVDRGEDLRPEAEGGGGHAGFPDATPAPPRALTDGDPPVAATGRRGQASSSGAPRRGGDA